jgi:hypothetical protein
LAFHLIGRLLYRLGYAGPEAVEHHDSRPAVAERARRSAALARTLLERGRDRAWSRIVEKQLVDKVRQPR